MSPENRSNDEEPAHELLYETGGDGWNEPEDDTWECLCGEEIASWVQRDPERSGRPDLDDVLHAHAVHVAAVVAAVERERDALREDVKIRDAEITRQHGIILALDNDAEQALIDRDEAIEAESQAGDRIAARWAVAIAENARLLARIAAVEALHFMRGRNILGRPVCAECSPLQPMPCPTLRALAASPTPTGPEPATDECEHGQTEWHEVVVTPLYEHRICPGPASPEPTEETPPTRWMPAPDTTWVNGVPSERDPGWSGWG